MKQSRQWIKLYTILVLFFSMLVILTNYVVDPMHLFAHNNVFNNKMYVIDERQQKSNYASFADFNYDALLIGSSRVANINPSNFLPLKTFNFACKSMVYDEYYDYIEFAKKKNGKDFKYIFIGLDFFSTNKALKSEQIKKLENIEESSEYFNNTNDKLYKIKTLFSCDCLKWSVKNILLNLIDKAPSEVYISRKSNDRFMHKWSKEKTGHELVSQLKTYSGMAYSDYVYDDSFKEHLSKVIKSNPNSKIIVFTNPVSKPLFDLLAEKKLIGYYAKWLKDIVDTFGSFHHFMNNNDITANHYDYFIDAHHMYPEKTGLITTRLLSPEKTKTDFGILINSENSENYINSVDKTAK